MLVCWQLFVLCGCTSFAQAFAGRGPTPSSSTRTSYSSTSSSSSSTPQPSDNSGSIPPGFAFAFADGASVQFELTPEHPLKVGAALGNSPSAPTLALQEDVQVQGGNANPKLSKGASTAFSLGVGLGFFLIGAIALVSYRKRKDHDENGHHHDFDFDYDGTLPSTSGSFTTVCDDETPESVSKNAVQQDPGQDAATYGAFGNASTFGGCSQEEDTQGRGYVRGAPAYVTVGSGRYRADSHGHSHGHGHRKSVPLIRSVTADSIVTVYDNFAELAGAGLVPSLQYTALTGSSPGPARTSPSPSSHDKFDNSNVSSNVNAHVSAYKTFAELAVGFDNAYAGTGFHRSPLSTIRTVVDGDHADVDDAAGGYGEISGSEDGYDDGVDLAAIMVAAEAAEELRQAQEQAEWLAEKAAAAAEAAAEAARAEKEQLQLLEQQAAAVQQAAEAAQEAHEQVQWLARRALQDKSRGDAVGAPGLGSGGLGGTVETLQLRKSVKSTSSVDWMAEMERQEEAEVARQALEREEWVLERDRRAQESAYISIIPSPLPTKPLSLRSQLQTRVTRGGTQRKSQV